MSNQLDPASSPVQPAPKSATEIAADMLGEIDWISPAEGYCDCPGRNRHSNKSGRRDCAVYLDNVPTLYCVHQSCSTAIAAINKKLRAALLNGKPVEERSIAEDKAIRKQREENERIRLRAAKSLPQLLDEFAWPYDQIIADSPILVTGNESEHWKMLLGKFDAADVVWIGDKFDSGKPEHARHFKAAGDWLKECSAPGPYICPVAFKNATHARSNDNVLTRKFLVVESDTLTRDQVGGIFRWLQAACDLTLVAIVDTAGKSLHGWFKYPAYEDAVDGLKLILPAMQCDPKLFTPSQPVRLPGALREGKFQKLVYLAKEVPGE
jgi:hypothetical protein